MEKIFIYGPSGAGKTTAGNRLAMQLNLPFVDLDNIIEKTTGKSIETIFEVEGETAFREFESQILLKVIAREGAAVIALGGGALLNPENRSAVEGKGRVLCLTAEPATLLKRLQSDDTTRPLLIGDPETKLEEYLSERADHYRSFPIQISTDELSPSKLISAVQIKLGHFYLTSMGAPYDVQINSGGIEKLGLYLNQRSLKGPVCIVADENTKSYAEIAKSSLNQSNYAAHIVEIPSGEAHKTIKTVEKLWQAFLQAGLERSSTVMAVGGGVVGDLAGFAAATFLRGVPWVAVPTTLLAMVDASIGGKTGADLRQGKNLVGAFHAPSYVLSDPEVLKTLPTREIRAGLAEVVKAAVIGDSMLFDASSNLKNFKISDEFIARSMAVKIQIIERDPFEGGERGLLNYGHTVGHAVEHVSGYKLLHGEAIAIGMAIEAHIAERGGLAAAGTTKQIVSCLQKLGLPVKIPDNLDKYKILETIQLDKKKKDGELRFALPQRIGQAALIELQEHVYTKAVLTG